MAVGHGVLAGGRRLTGVPGYHGLHVVVAVGKGAAPRELVLGHDGECLGVLVRGVVDAGIVPVAVGGFGGEELLAVRSVHVESDIAVVAQEELLRVEEVVLQTDGGQHAIALGVVFGQTAQGDGVLQTLLLAAHRRGAQNVVVLIEVASVGILSVDAQVWHLLVGNVEQRLVVLVVVTVCELELCAHHHAVADVVVELRTGAVAVVLLSDLCACASVVSARDVEVGTLAASLNSQIVVVGPTVLCDGIDPVGIVVVHLVFRPVGIVLELLEVVVTVRAVATELGHVEVGLLHHHREVVATEQMVARRLCGASELVAVGDLRLACRATLGLNLNDAICTA